MPSHPAYSDPSDYEQLPDRQASVDRDSRRRSTRACDQCRRTKSKCERDKGSSAKQPCHGCATLGLPCTYIGPSHKRGPPKGYILAIERRLHQVEALLGTIIGSDDPRARGLMQDLSRDELARQIVQRVDVGPFGSKGRVAHPFGSTKEDFLASIMTGINEEQQEASKGSTTSSPRVGNLALVSPSSTWQDNLQRLLSRASEMVFPQTAPEASHTGSESPDSRVRRASYPPMSGHVSSPTNRITLASPTVSLLPVAPFPSVLSADRALWDNTDGLERIDSESAVSDDSEIKYPACVEDVYVDHNAQLRIMNKVTGLHILSQCQKFLIGREDEYLSCPWPFTDPERQTALALASCPLQWPSEHHQHDLLQAFFDHVYPTFPVVMKSQVLRLYGRRSSTALVDVQPQVQLEQTAFDILLLSIFALSYRYLDGPAENPDYVSEAERLISSVRHKSHWVLSLALLLLGYRNIGVGCLEAAWMYIGMAIRMAQSLGIHRDTQGLIPCGLLHEEESVARQLIWAGCIIADRHLAVLLGRPMMINPTDCDVPPIAESQKCGQGDALFPLAQNELELSGASTILTCFNASRSLAVIVGSIIEQLYRTTRPAEPILELRAKSLEHQLSQWEQSALPMQAQFDNSDGSAPPACVIELHIQYWWAVTLLYRAFSAQGPLTRCFYSSVQSKATSICQDASAKMSSLASMFCELPKVASPILPGYMLSAGITSIHTLSVLRDDQGASSRLGGILTALQYIGNIWPVARAVHDLLKKTVSTPSSTPLLSPALPTSLRHKRSAQEVFCEDEPAGHEHEPKKVAGLQSSPVSFLKDQTERFDNFGHLLGLDSGIGLITSPPYPGFQYRSPHVDTQQVFPSLSGAGYPGDNFSAVASSSQPFDMW